jgi:hypothetical protein
MARTEEHFKYERFVLKAVTDIDEDIANVELDMDQEVRR